MYYVDVRQTYTIYIYHITYKEEDMMCTFLQDQQSTTRQTFNNKSCGLRGVDKSKIELKSAESIKPIQNTIHLFLCNCYSGAGSRFFLVIDLRYAVCYGTLWYSMCSMYKSQGMYSMHSMYNMYCTVCTICTDRTVCTICTVCIRMYPCT